MPYLPQGVSVQGFIFNLGVLPIAPMASPADESVKPVQMAIPPFSVPQTSH